MRLWNYVSTFSNLSGERLHQIYSKLKQEQEEEAGVGPSHLNGSAPGPIGRDGDPNYFPPFPRHVERQRGYSNMSTYQTSEPVQKGHDTAKFEAWKRRRRAETDNHFQVQPPSLRSMSNGAPRLSDPNSLGILGAGPSENRRFAGEKPFRTRQTGFPPRQGFSSGIK
jgi:chromodomain-helicase-DNA-binding protein 1